jgi:digeranylgeranylglycerophospholipid reductase
MKTVSDAIVIGGGPCGSFAALNLAKLGAGVTVFEEHNEIGVPSHCAGHLSIKSLRNLGLYPLPAKIVEDVFYGANFYSPKGTKFSVRFSYPMTCAVNRTLFDKHIAEMAQTAGVHYLLNSRVQSLQIEDGFVKGVTAHQNGENKFSAKVVVDAEGISSRILRQTGLSSLNRNALVYAVQAEMENVKDTEPDAVEVFLGKDYAPGFYGWLIPSTNGRAKVGLAGRTGNPKELLQRLILTHPVASKQLRRAKLLRMAFHPISLGGQIQRTYTNGFLAVGDVASHVKPTTGGGVIFGLTCAKIAAETAFQAIQKNHFSSDFLRLYQKRCEDLLGFDFSVMTRLRRTLDAISDEKIEEAIHFCKKIRLEKTLQDIEEIDFQGKTLVRVLRKPRILAALVYFSFIYLSANP